MARPEPPFVVQRQDVRLTFRPAACTIEAGRPLVQALLSHHHSTHFVCCLLQGVTVLEVVRRGGQVADALRLHAPPLPARVLQVTVDGQAAAFDMQFPDMGAEPWPPSPEEVRRRLARVNEKSDLGELFIPLPPPPPLSPSSAAHASAMQVDLDTVVVPTTASAAAAAAAVSTRTEVFTVSVTFVLPPTTAGSVFQSNHRQLVLSFFLSFFPSFFTWPAESGVDVQESTGQYRGRAFLRIAPCVFSTLVGRPRRGDGCPAWLPLSHIPGGLSLTFRLPGPARAPAH